MTERIKITISIVPPVIISLDLQFISLIFFENHHLTAHTRISNDRLSKFSISQESSIYIYIYIRTFIAWRPRRSTCHEASIRFNRKYPFPSVGKSFAWFTYDRANLHRMTKGRFWRRGIKLLCVTAEREYSIIIDVFSRSPLWIHRARDFIARRSSLNDELPIERHLWARTTKKNQSLSRRGYRRYAHRWDFFYKLWRKFKRISSNI